MNRADKQKVLDKIAKEIENCKICKEGKSGMAVPGEGNPAADVVFLGEAPGKTEAATGRPFVGRSGQLLRSLIREAGLKEEDVYITSPVKYLPDRGTPTPQDIVHGRIHLMKQLAVIQPKFVVLLGRVAAEGVLNRKVAVVKERGHVIEDPTSPSLRQGYGRQARLRGTRREGVKYFLTYHPAAALRFPVKFKALLVQDFKKIKKLLN
jgi:uracil-DNA glycosylase